MITLHGDRVDTIATRVYGSPSDDAMRTLIWTNRELFGIPQEFEGGVEFEAPNIVAQEYAQSEEPLVSSVTITNGRLVP